MNSTYDASRDRETTYAVRDLESRVQRLEIRDAQFEKRCEDLILLVKAQMWSEIW